MCFELPTQSGLTSDPLGSPWDTMGHSQQLQDIAHRKTYMLQRQ